MTGEITLRGQVLPVGGIKEKVLAAKRAGLKEMILCWQNEKDVDEINPEFIKGIKFHYVKNMKQVWNLLWNKNIFSSRQPNRCFCVIRLYTNFHVGCFKGLKELLYVHGGVSIFWTPNSLGWRINFPLLSKTFLKFVTCAVMDHHTGSVYFFHYNGPDDWRQFCL